MADRPRFVDELRGQLVQAEPGVERRQRLSRRMAVTAAVAGLAAGATVWGVVVVENDPNEVVTVSDGTDASPAATVVGARVSEFWTSLDTLIGGEVNPGVFWTGSEVLVLRTTNGGGGVVGERWNPATNEVLPIAASGLTWRYGPAMVWTGEEVLVVGGSSGPALNEIGAAYDPSTDSWRPIADPSDAVDGWENLLSGPGVWTGLEMIVWSAGLAYDPNTDSWREIATAPLPDRFQPLTVWTGKELIVWGGCWVPNAQCDETNSGLFADGAVYDPTTDAWTAMTPSPIPGAVHVVGGWSGTEVIVVLTEPDTSGTSKSAAFDPATMTWRELTTSPLSPRRGAAGVWADGRFVVWGGGNGASDGGFNDGAAYDPITDRWQTLPTSPGPGRSLHTMLPTNAGIYISATQTQGPPMLLQVPATRVPSPRISTGVVESSG